MTDEQRAAFAAAFARWFQGDESAVRYCLDLLTVAHAWDDLIDRDRAVEDVDGVFRRLLVDIPLNPFFQRFQAHLVPLAGSVILQWHAANALEAEPRGADRAKAYMLRAGIYQIFAYVAWLIGGDAWGRQVAPEVWRLYGETPDDFMGESDHA